MKAPLLRTPTTVALAVWLVVGLAVDAVAHAAQPDAVMGHARSHYEMGIQLFEARQPEQALVEFQSANALMPRPAAVFMMAQCEYLLGHLKEAKAHYEQYVGQSPEGEFVELAKDRILAIEHRPGILVVNSFPDKVDISVQPVSGGPAVASGQAPNNFAIPRGKYKVTASKPTFQSETRVVELDLAETKPIFFKLEPIPARLEIWTDPPNASLYVNGNRARNPFLQDVPPGKYEIYAESPDYRARTEELTLGPGEKRSFELPSSSFTLQYVQRSGRPELVFASALMGAVWGLGAVFVLMNPNVGINSQPDWPLTPMLGGAASGGVAGGLIANAVLPPYIKDNRALWLIGGMGFGGAEGVGIGLIADSSSFRPALYGSIAGLVVGTTAAALYSDKAPNYGRVALIESAGIGGALAGALIGVPLDDRQQVETTWATHSPTTQRPPVDNRYMVVRYALPMLIGMNLGIGAGLLAAYGPNQSNYGPSWQRVALVDLAALGGAIVGLTSSTLTNSTCLQDSKNCGLDFPNTTRAAMFTLSGGVLGIAAGVLLTRNFDAARGRDGSGSFKASWLPAPSLLPVDTGRGMAAVPGLLSAGRF